MGKRKSSENDSSGWRTGTRLDMDNVPSVISRYSVRGQILWDGAAGLLAD